MTQDDKNKCYVWIDNKKYDLTLFASSHPGGKYVLNEFHNKDATLFYHSTHKNRLVHKLFTPIEVIKDETLTKFDSDTITKIRYTVSNEYIELTRQIYKFLNNDVYAPMLWHIRAWIIAILQCIFLYLSIFLSESMTIIILFRILHGIMMALTGLCSLHDAAHGSISKNVWINRICTYIFADLLTGSSSQFWRIRHNYLHHPFVNDAMVDPDFDILPIAVTEFHHKFFPYEVKWFHKFQRYYILLLFQFYLYKVHFGSIYSLLIVKKVWSHTIPKPAQFETKINIILKTIFFAYYYMISFYVYFKLNGFHFMNAILLIHISNAVSATIAGVLFIISHNFINTKVFYSDNDIVKLDWAQAQIESSSNHSGKMFSFFCGGLSYQIEHHLFPRINSIHYPKISNIVSDFAKKNRFKYTHFNSIQENVISTMQSFPQR